MLKDSIEKNNSTNVNSREVEKLQKVLPQYFDKDGNFKLEEFKNMLSTEEVDLNKEGYSLDFLGKSYAKYESALETETVITPDVKNNDKAENENSENLYLVGDNIDGLKHLIKSYANKIKLVYIDPPYNTGKGGFVYNDKFDFTPKELSERIGIEEDEANRILNLEGKSTHSAWLTFMYPRLLLSRDLLSEDGVIFISIDNNELYNLKLICDEIFGEENFISNLSVENNPKGRKNSDHISVSSEYLLMYARNINESIFKEVIPKNASDMTKDENGRYVHNSGKRILVGQMSFNDEVTNPESDKNYSVYVNEDLNDLILKKETFNEINQTLINKGYKKYFSHNNDTLMENTYTASKFKELFENEALDFKEDKIYEKNFKDTIRMKSQLINRKYEAIVDGKKMDYSLHLTTTGANTHLKELFDTNQNLFEAPKNVNFIKLLIKLIENDDFIVLDFFSGSSTTAEATMQLNSEDGGNRKYIMVQLAEEIKKTKPAYKLGYKTIDVLARERINKAAQKIKNDTNAQIDYGYKTYFIKDVPENILDKIEDFNPAKNTNLMSIDFSTEAFAFNEVSGTDTIITTLINNDGYGLGSQIEYYQLNTYRAFKKDNSLYIIDEGLSSDDVKALIKDLENSVININRVVIYAHSISFSVLHELRNNLKNLKNSKTVHLIEEY